MKNIATSLRARLLNVSKEKQIPFQRILTLYKKEGILHRMVLTQYAENIVLKGGLLFYQLQGFAARPTKDIDLLGSDGSNEGSILIDILMAACELTIDDGLRYDPATIQVHSITGQTDHGAMRGSITGYLGSARTKLQIDMGFGDVITGGPVNRQYRTLLGNRAFAIQTYSDETIAAEKLEALVSLGTINSRYKDIYDLYELLIRSVLAEEKVIRASINTFLNRHRNTALPEFPQSLSEQYWTSSSFEDEWMRYLDRIAATQPDPEQLRKDLLPKLRSIYRAVRIVAVHKTMCERILQTFTL